MKKLAIIAAILACVSLNSCSTAGPFVTSISSDGQGGIVVEKNTIEFNPILGYVTNGDNPTTSTIKIQQLQPQVQQQYQPQYQPQTQQPVQKQRVVR